MSLRVGFLLLVAMLLQASTGRPQSAPLPGSDPSPLELVRGLRESGMTDLAIEYLREIETRPLSDTDRKSIPLERARCLLDAADDEPDEGARTSMIGEAKEAFNEFLLKNPTHPRAAEAALAIARLTSLEAKAQLNRARRMDIPPAPPSDAADRGEREKERDAAIAKRQDEAKKAQPLFLLASKLFGEAAKQMQVKLNDKTLDPFVRQNLARDKFDAELASAINQYNLAETVLAASIKGTQERTKYLEEARDGFSKLAEGPKSNRTVWIAKAWMAETLLDQGKPNDGAAEFDLILKSNIPEAEDGKRLVNFFQIRRKYLAAVSARSQTDLRESERLLRDWLNRYGGARRPTPESIAARYYRAFTLQLLTELALGPPPKDGKPQVVGGVNRTQFLEAEKLYRGLTQTDNDYTARAARNRMFIVRKLLDESDPSPAAFTSFETAQMASMIQIARLTDTEHALAKSTILRAELLRAARDRMESGKGSEGSPLAIVGAELRCRKAEAEIPERRAKVLALLERARALATAQDNPADVTDNLLRLIYFYQSANQPYQAAVLGEHVARTVRSTGGKSAAAGVLAINGYISAAAQVKVRIDDASQAEAAAATEDALRRSDRERAVVLARFLDKTFPNDVATDAARHRLAVLLVQDKQFDQAFEAITKVRGGYAQLTNARQLEGFIASQLIFGPADMPLPPGGKLAVYRRTVDDLARVVRPLPNASEDDVIGYLSVRVRLGQLYLAQSRADEEREKQSPGFDRALAMADEVLVTIPTFECLVDRTGAAKTLNLDGMELHSLGLDLRTRAMFLRGRALVDGGPNNLAAATAVVQPAIAEADKSGSLMTDKMKLWLGGKGDGTDDKPDPDATQKAKIAGITSGIDKVRRDIVMLGFKLLVRQGKPADAANVLAVLKKAGGNVADNQSTYELTALELAAPIPQLRREKKDVEAKALGDGVALLLKELSGVPNLSTSSILFIGQTLHTVEQHEDALKEFAKIAAPVVPKLQGIQPNTQWWQLDANRIDDNEARTKFQNEVRDYRFAQLYTAKALRGAKRLPDAEKLLTAIIGTADEKGRGWGHSSYDFRRELALTCEAKAAAAGSDIKVANPEWAKAHKEWNTLFQFAQARVKNLPMEATPEQIRHAKSAFFDAYFEIQRVMVTANTQLQAANQGLLAKSLEDVGKKIASMEITNKIAELEKAGPDKSIITPEVVTRFHELIDKNPAVKNAYKAAGGKLFLDRP